MIRGKSVRMQVFVRPQPCSQPVEPESKSIEYFLYRSPCLCHRETSLKPYGFLLVEWFVAAGTKLIPRRNAAQLSITAVVAAML